MENLTYQTKRIIDRVTHNYNQDLMIHTDPADSYSTASTPDPKPIDDMIPELETLFKSGADIILETNQGYDDEGGDCYQAYCIKPEFKSEYQHYWDMNYERDRKMLWQLCTMEYILAHPDHIITIWAGPY